MSENEEPNYKSSYDKLKAENIKLNSKMDSLLDQLSLERAEREKEIRTDLIAKINALCPTFEVADSVSSDSLGLLLKGMEAMPKENTKEDGDKPRGIKLDPKTPDTKLKINGVELGEEYESYKASYEKTAPEEVVTE
jgi:DNA-binding protein H-NS